MGTQGRMKPRGIATVVALLAAATLTACSGGGSDTASDATPLVAATDTVPIEGSATDPAGRFITYPDGLTARIVKVEQVPSDWGVDVPAGAAVVRVTVNLENGGADAVSISDPAPHMALYHGANRAEADPEGGYSGTRARQALQNELPQRVAPGLTVHYVRSFTVPTDGLDELAVYVNPRPDSYTEFTFTDAQAMLKQAH